MANLLELAERYLVGGCFGMFRLPDEALEAKFLSEAAGNDLVNLKGHRSVGGCRASIYNAMPEQSVATLADFMRRFAADNG